MDINQVVKIRGKLLSNTPNGVFVGESDTPFTLGIAIETALLQSKAVDIKQVREFSSILDLIEAKEKDLIISDEIKSILKKIFYSNYSGLVAGSLEELMEV